MSSENYYIRDKFRKNLCRYIVQAWSLLPDAEKPAILDLGCGTGEPALTLSSISDATIVSVDADAAALECFKKKVSELNLSDRIKIINRSVFDLDLQGRKFDIVWAEGLFNIIGFEKGLRLAAKHLRIEGMLVIHDELADEKKKEELIDANGYVMFGSFKLAEDTWQNDYFLPMEDFINLLSVKDKEKVYKNELLEIQYSKDNPERCRSVYYILQMK